VTLPSMAENDFEGWVKELVRKHFQNKFQKFADEVGVTFSALSRSVKKGSTSIETLLRICIATGESPEVVFTKAGKRDVNDLIRQVYGESARQSVSKRASEVALAFDAIQQNEGAKDFYHETLLALAGEKPRRAQTDGPSLAKKATGPGKSRRRGNRLDRA
jgi:transcriptional regulator with XRE-family HTH domain